MTSTWIKVKLLRKSRCTNLRLNAASQYSMTTTTNSHCTLTLILPTFFLAFPSSTKPHKTYFPIIYLYTTKCNKMTAVHLQLCTLPEATIVTFTFQYQSTLDKISGSESFTRWLAPWSELGARGASWGMLYYALGSPPPLWGQGVRGAPSSLPSLPGHSPHFPHP